MTAWLKRWQEFVGWAPLLLAMALTAWILLGAIQDRDDWVRWLIELPVKSIYAAAVSGVTYLVWRRWSFRMTDEQQARYQSDLLDGKPGAVTVYLTNAGFYLCTFCALLYYFAS